MPSYDDDDMADYENEMPDFHDEAEFDDYLNDEEYELMNEIFPEAKKALNDYLGWNNLSVKLAIFDNDFDLEKTLDDLKKNLKKKKTISSTPLNKQVSNGKMNLGLQEGTLSLEQLARKRIAERRLNGSVAIQKNYSDDVSKDKGISLLAKLKNMNGSGNMNNQKPLSLAERLRAKNSTGIPNREMSSNFIKNEVNPNSDQKSLHSKLRALRRKSATAKPIRSDEIIKAKDPEYIDQQQANKNILSTARDLVASLRNRNENDKFEYPPPENILDIIRSISSPYKENPECIRLQKRKYEDVFTVFYPSKTVHTNKRIDIQKNAISNFQKPSPDDVVMNAQASAFEQVKENVGNLQISDEKSTKDGEWYDSELEDLEKEEEPPKKTYKRVAVPTKPTDPVDIEHYLTNSKPHCSFVVLGHVDAGKSTLMGRLLYDLGAVDNNHMRKLKRESERIGKGSFHLAWVMDQTQEERERGVTVSICTSDFETPRTQFTIVDAPGHRDFVPNAIAGISQADVALLCVDCGTDAFESGFNLDGQTKEHTILARSMGVSQLIVAMNKLDTVDWYSGRFEQIKNELSSFFQDVGFRDDQVGWVPCSGLSGEGVCKAPYPESALWYKGTNLIQELETAATAISKSYHNDVIDCPFLFSILEVTPTNKSEEAIISGRVESGSIQPGETITIYPSEQSVIVGKILIGNEKVCSRIGIKGDFVTLRLRHAHVEDIEAGDLASSVDYDVPAMHEFPSQLLTFKMDRPILPGTPFILFRGVSQQPARVSKLISIVDKQDPSKVIKKKVRHLGSNQAAIVEIELTERKRWLPMLKLKDSKRLGRILLRKDGRTIAAGAVL